MATGNPRSHFLTIYRDDDGEARFARAKGHKNLHAQASWTYDSVAGRAKSNSSMGLYPKNSKNESTWGALDFDAHDGNDEVAKDRSIRAFSLLLEYRDRYLLLSASGRGYHVFIFAREPRPVAEWVHLLTDTAGIVGAPIQDGVCELYPNERTEKQTTGHGIRVPGAINPVTNKPELILADTINPLVEQLIEAQKGQKPRSLTSETNLPRVLVGDRETVSSSYTQEHGCFASGTTKELIEKTLAKFEIKAKSVRSKTLARMTGELLHKFGRQLSEKIVRWHYHLYQEYFAASLKAHMREFNDAWDRFRKQEIQEFSAKEHAIFDQLRSEPQREAFSLLRSFSNHAGGADFPVGQSSLADRLSITQQGASCVIGRLEELRAIDKTANAVTNSKAARYRWIANDCGSA
jgi:DNA-binding MarR family transcriptional regulator